MKHRYPKVSKNFKVLARHRLLFGYVTFNDLERKETYHLHKPKFRYRTFFKERALAFDGMRQACLADKPDIDNLYVKYYLAYLHEKWKDQKGKLY